MKSDGVMDTHEEGAGGEAKMRESQRVTDRVRKVTDRTEKVTDRE
ncbi:hypothetical protein [Lysinibacillus sphaericus]|uniref:Uncharacterized protein n=1 Tax=Lysinibacillus sphaericus CBAM5 TaxID=1400869 RepID=W7REK0_LYSSH|nr:hypothetical protein [Lysinibacillus sphaericus]EWH30302.1 hypothetical protein P799_25980 [Lysinibacillus sphaericus CBAM5]